MYDRILDVLTPDIGGDDELWRTYHENSKTERYHRPPPNAVVRARMEQMSPTLDYLGYPAIDLPPPAPLEMTVGDAIRARQTCRDMTECPVTLADLSALLFAAYGETRDDAIPDQPRSFRTIPSGGALYPLDLYVHSARIEGLAAGLYHYNPSRHGLAQVIRGDLTHRLSGAMVQSDMPLNAAAQVFVTGFFERSAFKYAERSYRFVLIEAGHLMQNFCLAATALGYGTTCVGGYFDREIDAILGLDGIRRSTVYMGVLGKDRSPRTP